MSGDPMTVELELKSLRDRVSKLEKAVFAAGELKPRKQEQAGKGFKGATGGVRLLLSKGFFRSKKRLSDVTASLKQEGYLYSQQAFHDALRRLSKAGGPLVTIREGGNKVYAERK